MEKPQRLQIIYETAAAMITRTPGAWAQYLRFAAWLHKYPFNNTLLAYAQAPDASLLATEEVWQRLGRQPIPHAKRIAVCEYGSTGETLKFLFDVTQTAGSALPTIWSVEKDMRHRLADELLKTYNIVGSSLHLAITHLLYTTANQDFESMMRDFELDTGSHFFAELPKEGLYREIREVAEAGARILVSARCGMEMQDVDMQAIATVPHFDTVPLVIRLGNITTSLAKTALRTIEDTVRKIDRQLRNPQ